MSEQIYFTNYLCFSQIQAEEHLRNKVSALNWQSLLDHICEPDMASKIEGFTEVDGTLLFINQGKAFLIGDKLKSSVFGK